jgi:hypothetical protein
VTGHSFWPGWTARGCLVGDGRRRAKWWLVQSRAARSVAERWEGKSGAGSGLLGVDWSRDKEAQPTWGGDD